MFSRRLILFTAVAAALAATAGVIASHSVEPVERGHGMPAAADRQAAPPETSGWSNLGEVRQSLANISIETRAQLELTPASIAGTRVAFTFPDATPNFGGISVYEVRRPGKGSCLFMLDAGGCGANNPAVRAADALAVQLSVSDLDGPSGPLPIVLFGQAAPQVSSVEVTCSGTTYKVTLAEGIVAWVAPTASIGPRDCTLEAAVTGGETYRTQL